jgi:hypothetical protein
MLKGKNSKKGAYTRDTGEVSIAVLTVIEEASHSLGQILMVVGEMRHFQERQTHLQQNKKQAERQRRILKMTSFVRLANAFLLLGPPPFHQCTVG